MNHRKLNKINVLLSHMNIFTFKSTTLWVCFGKLVPSVIVILETKSNQKTGT